MVVLVVLVTVGCGGDNSESTPSTPTGPVPTVASRGNVLQGRTVFETNCQVCHLSGGVEAGNGPVLAKMNLTEGAIRTQIDEPRNAMPPDIVSGEELDDVIAFVVSLQ